MQYTLMHKNVPVIDFELDDETCVIMKITEVFHESHIPLGVSAKDGVVNRKQFNDWWVGRSIPASRSGIREALDAMQMASTKQLITKCLGLSLSDQYWMRPKDKAVTWEQINFFQNDFSEDVGDALFGKAQYSDQFDFSSPDNTSDGWLPKRWKIIDGKRCLIKGGSNPYHQQPYNEVIASAIMKRLNIPHVPYRLIWNDGKPYSVCEDFITPDTELISAWHIVKNKKKDNQTSVLQHYVDCCKELGIENARDEIDKMIVLDYLIVNGDRHFNNFGLVRDAETLEWLGTAPIYDNGTSLWFDQIDSSILAQRRMESKPFRKYHDEQIRLVSSFEWIDFAALRGIEEEVNEILLTFPENPYISEERRKRICSAVAERIEMLETISLQKVPKPIQTNWNQTM